MKRIDRTWKLWGLGLALMAMMVPGCQRTETEEGTEIDRDRLGEAWESIGDEARELEPAFEDATITARVLSRIAADREVSVFDIDVSTELGIVTLEGVVETEEQRAHAEALALETSGVVRVENRIQVEGPDDDSEGGEPAADGDAAAY